MTSKTTPKATPEVAPVLTPARLGRGKTSGIWQAIHTDFPGFERRRLAARSDWRVIAAQLAAEGVEDGAGRAPSAAIVKRTFYRVRLAVRQDRKALAALEAAQAAEAGRTLAARTERAGLEARERLAELVAQAAKGTEAERLAVLGALPHLLGFLGLSTPAVPLAVPPVAVPKVTPATPHVAPHVAPEATPEAAPETAPHVAPEVTPRAAPAARRDPLAPPVLVKKAATTPEEIVREELEERSRAQHRRRMRILNGEPADPAPVVEAPAPAPAAEPAPAPVESWRGKHVTKMTPEETEAAIKADSDAEYARIVAVLKGDTPAAPAAEPAPLAVGRRNVFGMIEMTPEELATLPMDKVPARYREQEVARRSEARRAGVAADLDAQHAEMLARMASAKSGAKSVVSQFEILCAAPDELSIG